MEFRCSIMANTLEQSPGVLFVAQAFHTRNNLAKVAIIAGDLLFSESLQPMKKILTAVVIILTILTSCKKKEYDIVIRNGMVYDGLGGAPVMTDLAIQGDSIAFIGDLSDAKGKKEIDAKGLAVAPGFINMLS